MSFFMHVQHTVGIDLETGTNLLFQIDGCPDTRSSLVLVFHTHMRALLWSIFLHARQPQSLDRRPASKTFYVVKGPQIS